MEVVKQLIALPIIALVVYYAFHPKVLWSTAWGLRQRNKGHGYSFFESDYGRNLIRSMRLAGFMFLSYMLLQTPPISLPGSLVAALLLGASTFIIALIFGK